MVEATQTKIRRVAVLGASGRMGSEAVKTITDAPDLELVAALGREDSLEKLVETNAEIMVDLTVPTATETNVRFAVEHGVHAVVGTTGWTEERVESLRELLDEHPQVGVLIAPNFALGSILATEFAAKAAPYFESVEIIEIHTLIRSMPPREQPLTRHAGLRLREKKRDVGSARMLPRAILWALAAAKLRVLTCMRCGFAAWLRIRKFCWATPDSF